MSLTYRAPTMGMYPITVLIEPDWADTGQTIMGDITSETLRARVDYATEPFESRMPFSHMCITNNLGPIDVADKYRLTRKGIQYKIKRIRDWEGFYVLELDEVIGA